MNTRTHKLLHYILIVLMVLAPLRSVIAMQQSHCEMSASPMHATHKSDHSVMHDMTMMPIVDVDKKQSNNSHHCCSNNESLCQSNCDMSSSVSILIQTAIFSPNYAHIVSSVALTSDRIPGELSPPWRPPLAFL